MTSMFRAAANPYDDIVGKATHEDLLSEDWDANLQICDRVSEEGEQGAKDAVASLGKRLIHRNPNVQIFALELANSLAQNCGRPAHAELSSRAWTSALDRLISDRTTVAQVKTRALKFVQQWTKQFGSDPSLGVMQELYDSLKARKMFDAVDDAPKVGGGGGVAADEERRERLRREEEEELARVLELSMRDKGGRGGAATNRAGEGSAGPSGSSAPQPEQRNTTSTGPSAQPYVARDPTPPPVLPSKATAARVRAIYPFTTTERGELSFDKGDVIKVIDRMYDEWYTGAVGGRIGIFPVSYVEPLPDPTPAELAKEAQDEARVFAAQGLIVNLQRMLDRLDPSRGDRIEDSPEVEELYRRVVEVQPEIVGLMKKYADQKAELEHIHAGFIKAQRQYAKMTQPPQAQPAYPIAYAGHPQYAPRPGHAHRASSYGSLAPGGAPYQGQTFQGSPAGPGHPSPQAQPDQQAAIAAAWAQYYQQQAQAGAAAPAGGASPANTQPGAAVPAQSQEEAAKIAAAWQAYYAAQAQYAQQMAAQGWSQAQIQQAQAQAAGQGLGGQPAHQPAPQAAQQGSQEGYAPDRSADNASIRSSSGPAAPQGHDNSREQAPYGHHSSGSMSMPQPQIYGQPMNHANQSQTSLLPPNAPIGQNAAFLPAQGQPAQISASPQPMMPAPSMSFPSAPQEEPTLQQQHSQSSGNYAPPGQTGQAWQPSAPGQAQLPSSPGQSPRMEHGQVAQRQPQTGLETSIAQMAFQ
ncbi:hypothetical protein NliqN6_0203 [Naganishia liquefaciens]|uniref:Class E vacuolar protein-sorting machinery protein HSE1 n=1 Tax=Naganishia liquefaciens TaxID=104408 RepID=A0A8H3YDH8_9TREE|nr:hypothetical protein NliqN6_0203 [Naganishia liquefaciens]